MSGHFGASPYSFSLKQRLECRSEYPVDMFKEAIHENGLGDLGENFQKQRLHCCHRVALIGGIAKKGKSFQNSIVLAKLTDATFKASRIGRRSS